MPAGSPRRTKRDLGEVVRPTGVVHDRRVWSGDSEWGNGMTERSVAPRVRAGTSSSPERLRVLLVEDDEGDAFLVRELLSEAEAPFDLAVATTLREAMTMMRDIQCILLD